MMIDVVIFRSVGDVLMGTPICKAIKEKYPGCTIRFHTEIPYTDLIDGCPYIDDVIGHAVKEGKPGEPYLGDILSVYNYVRQNPSDHLATMAMVNSADMWWYRNPKYFANKFHMIDFYASRTGLGISVGNKHIILPIIAADHPSIAKANSFKAGAGKYVCMHTKCGWQEKDWPIGKFNSLSAWIEKQYGFKTIQLGGPRDQLIAGAIDARGKENARELNKEVGSIDWKTPQLLIKDCEFYVGGDSGLLYMAEGYNKHAFAPMGGTSSQDTVQGIDGRDYPTCPAGPQGPNMHYVEPIRPMSEHCRPHTCWSPCRFSEKCIDTISLEFMQENIKRFIEDS